MSAPPPLPPRTRPRRSAPSRSAEEGARTLYAALIGDESILGTGGLIGVDGKRVAWPLP